MTGLKHTLRELGELERADKIEQAAELASARGLHARARKLWERACRFDLAAAAALAADEPERALLLAARASAAGLEQKAIAALTEDPSRALRTAHLALTAGACSAAGRLLSALSEHALAALAFERSGALLEAAECHERAGQVRDALRCLELAIEGGPRAAGARVHLGLLLERSARPMDAARVVQRIAPDAPERLEALALLQRIWECLAMPAAALEVERELDMKSSEVIALPPVSRALPLPETGDVLFGRYRVAALAAKTQTAHVFEARDGIFDRRVAIKVFSAACLRDAGRDALLRFEREARAVGQLKHPAIVPVLEYLPQGPAVVLQWMTGGSLAETFAKGPLAPARGVEIVRAVLAALGEAHRRGILHRDVKPSNVLFDGAGAAHLSDFGSAHISDVAKTVTAGVIGTLAYMAPEQRLGQPAGMQSDVYGAGALLWQALSGAPPGITTEFLSPELGVTHRRIAESLIAPEQERPLDTERARALLDSVRWPTGIPNQRPVSHAPVPTPRAASARLEPRVGALFYDTVLERDVYVLAADTATLERVQALARADHPALPSVLCFRADEASVWVEAVRGEPLRSCTLQERRFLESGLEALHRHNGVHGMLDADHVVRGPGGVRFRFALTEVRVPARDEMRALCNRLDAIARAH